MRHSILLTFAAEVLSVGGVDAVVAAMTNFKQDTAMLRMACQTTLRSVDCMCVSALAICSVILFTISGTAFLQSSKNLSKNNDYELCDVLILLDLGSY